MGVTQRLEACFPGRLRQACAEGACSFDGAAEAPAHACDVAILKGEEVAPPGRKAADCLVFVEEAGRPVLVVFVVELKGGAFRVDDVRRKLSQSRADALQILNDKLRRSGRIELVLVHAGKDPQAIKALAATRVGRQMVRLAARHLSLAAALAAQ